MTKQFRFLLIISMLLVYIPVCISQEVQTEFGNNQNLQIFVVYEKTNFKDKVIKQLLEYSADTKFVYKFCELRNIKNEEMDKYDKVIFLCKLEGGKVNTTAYGLIKTLPNKDNILVVLTNFFNSPLPELAKQNTEGIDVISSASKIVKVKDIAKEIFNWLVSSND